MVMLPLLLFLVLDRRRLGRDLREIDRWNGDDRRWLGLAVRGYTLRGRPMPPQGRFNAGQKLNVVLVAAMALGFAATGGILMHKQDVPPWLVSRALWLHAFLAVVRHRPLRRAPGPRVHHQARPHLPGRHDPGLDTRGPRPRAAPALVAGRDRRERRARTPAWRRSGMPERPGPSADPTADERQPDPSRAPIRPCRPSVVSFRFSASWAQNGRTYQKGNANAGHKRRRRQHQLHAHR